MHNVMAADRLHIVLSAQEKERYRVLAERDGLTLSGWVRRAVRERASEYDLATRFETTEDLEAFFDACDRAAEEESGDEPDWAEYQAMISESRRSGHSDP